MANLLSNIKLNELSLVDDPANEHARVTIFKRTDKKKENGMSDALTKQVGDLTKQVEELTKKLEDETAAKSKAEETAAALKADLELAEKKSKLSSEEKEYMDDIEDEDEKKKFLNATAKQRSALIEKAKAGDEIIKVNGRDIKKSAVGDEVFEALKAQQEQAEADRERFEKAEKARVEAELTDIVKTKYAHVAGDVGERVEMLKAMRDMSETTRKAFEKVFESAEKLAKAAFDTKGSAYSYTPQADDDVSKARSKFDDLVEKEMQASNVVKSVATQRIAERHPDLIKQFNGQPAN